MSSHVTCHAVSIQHSLKGTLMENLHQSESGSLNLWTDFDHFFYFDIFLHMFGWFVDGHMATWCRSTLGCQVSSPKITTWTKGRRRKPCTKHRRFTFFRVTKLCFPCVLRLGRLGICKDVLTLWEGLCLLQGHIWGTQQLDVKQRLKIHDVFPISKLLQVFNPLWLIDQPQASKEHKDDIKPYITSICGAVSRHGKPWQNMAKHGKTWQKPSPDFCLQRWNLHVLALDIIFLWFSAAALKAAMPCCCKANFSNIPTWKLARNQIATVQRSCALAVLQIGVVHLGEEVDSIHLIMVTFFARSFCFSMNDLQRPRGYNCQLNWCEADPDVTQSEASAKWNPSRMFQ